MPSVGDLSDRVVPNVDVRDGDLVKIVSAGTIQEFKQDGGGVRKCLQIDIECPAEGNIKKITLNPTSSRALGSAYGDASEEWVGKEALVQIAKMNVRGQMKDVIYLSPVKQEGG